MQLTLQIADQHVEAFKDFLQQFRFPVTIENADEEIDADPSMEQLKTEMRQAVQELNLAKKGKLKLPTLTDFLDELSH
jgi:hypothetical protein